VLNLNNIYQLAETELVRRHEIRVTAFSMVLIVQGRVDVALNERFSRCAKKIACRVCCESHGDENIAGVGGRSR
jgi:hypothetical protein